MTTADEQTVSALIDEGGGTLTATLGNLTFSLSIPADALLSPETITMTPISSITGSPLEEAPVGGVVFAPDGLLLAAPALLTITGGPSTEDTIGFGFDGAGEDFHLVPFVPGDGVVIPVPHFSGVGYGAASPAIVARIAEQHVAGGLNAIMQMAADKMKAIQAAREDPEWQQALIEDLEKMAAASAKLAEDGMTAAADDPLVLGSVAILQLLAAERVFELLGIAETVDLSKVLALLDKWDAAVDALCAEKATEPGATAKPVLSVDPMAMINLILASVRQRQLVTGVETPWPEVEARLDACKFTISVKPEIAWHAERLFDASLEDAPETHDMVLSGPLTSLVLSVSQAPRMPLGVSRYRWKADVLLAVSSFTTTDDCWAGAPPFTITGPGFEPTLQVEMVPDLNIPRPIGSPTKGAAIRQPTMAAAVTLYLRGGVGWTWVDRGCDAGNPKNTIGLMLEPLWAGVSGASPERVSFGGESLGWTRQAPGSSYLGHGGYYTITTDVTFSAAR